MSSEAEAVPEAPVAVAEAEAAVEEPAVAAEAAVEPVESVESVEAVEADCMCLGVLELSSSCRVSLSRLSSLYTLSSVLSSSSLTWSFAILHEAL